MKKQKNIVVTMSFFIVLLFSFFLFGMKYNRDNRSFPLALATKENKIDLSFKQNKMASIYQIIITDGKSNILYNNKTKDNELSLDVGVEYGSKYNVSVIAYDKDGNKVSESKNQTITWTKPTFDKSIDYVSNVRKDYYLYIKGDINKDTKITYYLAKDKIYEENVTKEKIPFPSKLFNHKGETIRAVLSENGKIMDKLDILINKQVIEAITIDSPIDNSEYNYDDLIVNFSGGKGATKFIVSVYEEEELIFTKTFTGSAMTIPKNFFSDDVLYKLIVSGTFNDYENTKTIGDSSFRLISKDKVRPVYVSRNTYVDLGASVELFTRTKNATIIYTLDGTKPSLANGIVYNTPIIITQNTSIKALAINNDNIESVINTYEFIPEKKNIVIYVSPSNQTRNQGVEAAGYSVEKVEMNKLADILIPKLKSAGYTVYRNNPSTTINIWASESKKVKADLHLALHSNGSVMHDESGVKTYIDAEDNKTYSLANIIEDALINVYYDKSNKNNRVSYANSMLGEVRPNLVAFGILLEIGYHDDYNDAFWIMNNMNNIADSIVGALNQYYGY